MPLAEPLELPATTSPAVIVSQTSQPELVDTHLHQDGRLTNPAPVAQVKVEPVHSNIPEGVIPANLNGVPDAAIAPEARQTINTTEVETLKAISSVDPATNAVGWDETFSDPENVPKEIVRGLANDTLWMLIRRFNGQLQHVKTIESTPRVGRLDLEAAWEEEFSPDKLRTQVERLYYTVFIGLAGFANHIARLRSWNERKRSTTWCASYFLAWALNLIWPTIAALVILLIIHPPIRHVIFPPAPIAAISATSGNVQKPKAGELKSTDSITGAEEKHKGEAAEREASNFVTSFATVVVGSVLGKTNDRKDGENTDKMDEKVPDPVQVLTTAAEAQQNARGVDPPPTQDHTKEPMMDSMWKNIRPVMRAMSDAADVWERFGNALTPTLPYRDTPRLKLAGVVAGLFFTSLIINPTIISRILGLVVGFLFFGQPILTRGLHWLNTNIPNWPEYLELRNTLLLGVPTNAQLTLTLLRLGEAEKTPLPPPPVYSDSPEHAKEEEPEVPSDYEYESDDELADGHDLDADHQRPKGAANDEVEKPKKRRRIVNALKNVAQGGVTTVLGVDKVKAKVGSEHAKQRLGALPKGPDVSPEAKMADGPSLYKARSHGKKGYLIISTTATTPCISFIEQNLITKDEAAFSIQLEDIKELKKVGGLGFKSKLVVGYVLGKEVADGLEIVDKLGERHLLTAIHRRNELFNRLIAMAGQKWESW